MITEEERNEIRDERTLELEDFFKQRAKNLAQRHDLFVKKLKAYYCEKLPRKSDEFCNKCRKCIKVDNLNKEVYGDE